MNLLESWKNKKELIRERVGLSAYETWFSSLQIKEKEGGGLVIEAPDEFFKNWIVEHYLTIIKDCLSVSSDSNVSIEVAVNSSLPLSSIEPKKEVFQDTNRNKESINLNPRFSFNNFVIGPSNRFAYAACLAVAESPAKAYNPLFIYGQVGLGKTHLMQAITHTIKTTYSNVNSCHPPSFNLPIPTEI